MDKFRRALASLFALLFIISGWLAVPAFSLERTAFDPASYQQAFTRSDIYTRMPGILAEALYNANSASPQADPYLQLLTPTDWQNIVTSLLGPQDIQTITDSALNSSFAFLNGEAEAVALSLAPLKANLTGPGGVEVAKQILQAQPDCTGQQLLEIGLGFFVGSITLCNPPEDMFNIFMPLIEAQLQAASQAIPNEVTLLSAASFDPANDPRARLKQVRGVMKVTPFFPVFFLFALTAFAVRSLMDWLRWWGYPFLLMGLGNFALGLFGAPMLGWLAGKFLQAQGAGLLPAVLISAFQETFSAATGQLLRPVFMTGFIVAGIGLGMIAASLLVERTRPTGR